MRALYRTLHVAQSVQAIRTARKQAVVQDHKEATKPFVKMLMQAPRACAAAGDVAAGAVQQYILTQRGPWDCGVLLLRADVSDGRVCAELAAVHSSPTFAVAHWHSGASTCIAGTGECTMACCQCGRRRMLDHLPTAMTGADLVIKMGVCMWAGAKSAAAHTSLALRLSLTGMRVRACWPCVVLHSTGRAPCSPCLICHSPAPGTPLPSATDMATSQALPLSSYGDLLLKCSSRFSAVAHACQLHEYIKPVSCPLRRHGRPASTAAIHCPDGPRGHTSILRLPGQLAAAKMTAGNLEGFCQVQAGSWEAQAAVHIAHGPGTAPACFGCLASWQLLGSQPPAGIARLKPPACLLLACC
jgi:hypothetical protein